MLLLIVCTISPVYYQKFLSERYISRIGRQYKRSSSHFKSIFCLYRKGLGSMTSSLQTKKFGTKITTRCMTILFYPLFYHLKAVPILTKMFENVLAHAQDLVHFSKGSLTFHEKNLRYITTCSSTLRINLIFSHNHFHVLQFCQTFRS